MEDGTGWPSDRGTLDHLSRTMKQTRETDARLFEQQMRVERPAEAGYPRTLYLPAPGLGPRSVALQEHPGDAIGRRGSADNRDLREAYSPFATFATAVDPATGGLGRVGGGGGSKQITVDMAGAAAPTDRADLADVTVARPDSEGEAAGSSGPTGDGSKD